MNKHELKELVHDIGKLLYNFITHRILWLFVAMTVLFYILLVQLFQLQIAEADVFRLTQPTRTEVVSRPLPALRGTIYDRYGRPLAVNELTFVVKMDPSVRISNEALLALALLFEQNSEDYVDSFPISRELPLEFTITGATPEQIARREYRWKDDMAISNPETATAEESWNFLVTQFDINPELSHDDIRRIMNFRSKIFAQRFLGWGHYDPTPIVFAYNVSPETMAVIEEQSDFFTGLFIDIQTRRHYPAGRYVSHMIGYLRPITAPQLASYAHLGYTEDDLFGRAGLELSMEHALRGTPGRERFEINSAGRRLTSPERYVDPQPGNRIFLTIDLELQIAAFHALEGALSDTLINRLNMPYDRTNGTTPEEVFISFVNANNLDIRRVLDAEPGSLAFPMRQYIMARFPDATAHASNRDDIQGIIAEGITNRRISPAMMLLTLIGTEQITDPDGHIEARLIARPAAARDILIEKIQKRELTPQLLNMDPATGSLVITCIHTGAVLAAASYPSFDNNRLINNFDSEYFNRINNLDPTTPMVNRPFRETRAPGSTFKMFTGVAALETGTIGSGTRIWDGVNFTAAGHPPLRCWHSGGHGSINVVQAVAVSCNYFFAEVAFRMGNARRNTTVEGIETLGRYMAMFGLNGPTGVEIGEHPIDLRGQGFDGNVMSSPELKRHLYLQRNPFAPANTLAWTDGNTVQTAIGQGFADHTSAQMARGMAAIANRGINYRLFLVGYTKDFYGVVSQTEPMAMNHGIETSDTTWDAIIEGMRLVTEPGAGGTAVGPFRDFPIQVAGKTGTAEQVRGRFSHSAFGAFAPLDDPQIAVYVSIPFGHTTAYRQIATHITRDMIGVALRLDSKPQLPEPLNNLTS